MKYIRIFALWAAILFGFSAMGQSGSKELLTGISVIHLTNKGYDNTGLGIDLGFLFHFSHQSAVVVDLEGLLFPHRYNHDINAFDFRIGYRFTVPLTALYFQPNIGFVSSKFYHEEGYYNGFLKALEMGVRLPASKRPVELAVNINDADPLPNTITRYKRRMVWLGFKAAIVFPVR